MIVLIEDVHLWILPYKKEEMYAVMSVVSRRELVTLTNEILKIDEAAFIISNETHNVRGRGFTLPNIDL